MNNMIYLIQGQADLINSFLELKDRENVDVIFLTYDRPLEGALFYPNSTWSEGRNLLLKEALAHDNDYLYYIFLDDDVVFEKGSFVEFETQLLKYQPAIAVPVVDLTRNTILGFGMKNRRFPFVPCQPFLWNDDQFVAFHRDVVQDGFLLPYIGKFEHLSWWAATVIEETLIQSFYFPYALQFNHIIVKNVCHREYPRNSFAREVNEWLSAQFQGSVRHPRQRELTFHPRGEIRRLLTRPHIWLRLNILRMFLLMKWMRYSKKASYRIPKDIIQAKLNPHSDLYERYVTS